MAFQWEPSTLPPYEEVMEPISVQPKFKSILNTVVWAESTLMILTIGLALFLLVVILSRDRLRQRAFNQLLVSFAVGTIIFNLIVRPGTIKDEEGVHPMTVSYCGTYVLLCKVEELVMPLTLWMLSIDRLLAMRNPEGYSKRMTKLTRAALISFPWLFAFLVTVIEIFILGDGIITRYAESSDDPYFDEISGFAERSCMVLYSESDYRRVRIMMRIFGAAIPIMPLFVASIAIVIVYIRRRGVRVCDEVGELLVPPGSIAFCLVLNLIALVIVIETTVQRETDYTRSFEFIYTQWVWSGTQLLTGILMMFVLPDIRKVIAGICCCAGDPTGEKKSLLADEKEMKSTSEEPKPEP